MATDVCLAARARRLNRILSALYDERLRDIGISIGQLDMLVTLLYKGRPLRSIDLAREMSMERSTVSRNVSKLAKAGFVNVTRGGNDRDRLIEVTDLGQDIVARAESGWTEAQRRARGLLGERGSRHLENMAAPPASAPATAR